MPFDPRTCLRAFVALPRTCLPLELPQRGSLTQAERNAFTIVAGNALAKAGAEATSLSWRSEVLAQSDEGSEEAAFAAVAFLEARGTEAGRNLPCSATGRTGLAGCEGPGHVAGAVPRIPVSEGRPALLRDGLVHQRRDERGPVGVPEHDEGGGGADRKRQLQKEPCRNQPDQDVRPFDAVRRSRQVNDARGAPPSRAARRSPARRKIARSPAFSCLMPASRPSFSGTQARRHA